MTSREQFWFFHPFRVRYSEIDAQGVVFNAHYLTYFDTTITEYFRALGYDQYADARKTGIDFHIVKSVIEYKAPILFDQELEVGARVVRIGNSSLVLERRRVFTTRRAASFDAESNHRFWYGHFRRLAPDYTLSPTKAKAIADAVGP
jgi:YbgC/YbaW family acyl-CoA thioester hydrolase